MNLSNRVTNSVLTFIGRRNLVLSILCIVTPPLGLIFFTVQIYAAKPKYFEQPVYVGVGPRSYYYLAILIPTKTNFSIKLQALPRTRDLGESLLCSVLDRFDAPAALFGFQFGFNI